MRRRSPRRRLQRRPHPDPVRCAVRISGHSRPNGFTGNVVADRYPQRSDPNGSPVVIIAVVVTHNIDAQCEPGNLGPDDFGSDNDSANGGADDELPVRLERAQLPVYGPVDLQWQGSCNLLGELRLPTAVQRTALRVQRSADLQSSRRGAVRRQLCV